MVTRGNIELQIESLVIVKYVSLYSKLEKLIRCIFQYKIKNINNEYRNKLYFYFGGTVGNSVYIDYNKDSLTINSRTYNDNEMFNDLSLNKIIKIDKKDTMIECFKRLRVQSLQTKTIYYSLHDSCIKLINVRNIIAHELDNIKFDERKDIIEKLSVPYITKNPCSWLEGFDLNLMNDET